MPDLSPKCPCCFLSNADVLRLYSAMVSSPAFWVCHECHRRPDVAHAITAESKRFAKTTLWCEANVWPKSAA